jgi:ATP-binding cassette, subfamily B, bacterial
MAEPIGHEIEGLPGMPVVFQSDLIDCGLACLAMMLTYHGVPTTLPDLHREVDLTADGASLLALAEAARRRGFSTRAYALGSPADLATLPLPAIAHCHGQHYLVIERLSTESLVAIDPMGGRFEMPAIYLRELNARYALVLTATGV